MSPRLDLTAQRFGRWTVLCYAGKRGEASMWLCRCECGSEHEIYARNLRNGRSTQCCACMHRGRRRVITCGGVSRTMTEWAVALGVGESTIACRLKRYPVETALQKRLPRPPAGTAGRLIMFRGTRLNITGWAARLGISRPGLERRLSRMSVKQALTKPVVEKPRLITFRGITLSITGWAARLGLSGRGLKYRLSRMSVEEALTKPVVKKQQASRRR